MKYTINVCHDAEEGVWFVQDSDVPGLNVEASTLDELVAIISDLAPELVSENIPDAGQPVTLCVQHVVERGPAHPV